MMHEAMKSRETEMSESPTARFLTSAIRVSGLSQTEIAKRIGYSWPNVISMMKQGQTKVPIDRIPALAQTCGVDERVFLETALAEYQPEVWEVLSHHLQPRGEGRTEGTEGGSVE